MKNVLIKNSLYCIVIIALFLMSNCKINKSDIESFRNSIIVDIDKDKNFDEIIYENDSISIYLLNNKNHIISKYEYEIFSYDGTIVLDTIYYNYSESLIEVYLIDNRFERNKINYKVKFKKPYFYLVYVQSTSEVPYDDYIENTICDTSINIQFPLKTNDFYKLVEKIKSCITYKSYY